MIEVIVVVVTGSEIGGAVWMKFYPRGIGRRPMCGTALELYRFRLYLAITMLLSS